MGKPYGVVARVNIGQVIISVRSKDSNKDAVIEALRRSMYKFPGQQKIIVSKKYGFTPFTREDYLKRRQEGTVVPDRNYVRILRRRGPLEQIRDFPSYQPAL